MSKFWQIVAAYWPLFMALVGWPLVSAVLNWYLWWDTPENWERFKKEHPNYAFLVRLSRAMGPHLRKFAQAWRDYAEAKTPPLPMPPKPPQSP